MKIKQIAEDYDIKLINVTKKNIDKYSKLYKIKKEDLINNAEIIGNEELILGIFDDKEVRIAAFFHEIGHTLISDKFEKLVNCDCLLIEYKAWILGLKAAKKYGYKFSNKTFKYILTSLNSYYEDALSRYEKRKKNKNKH